MKVKSNLRQKNRLQNRNTAKRTIKTKRKKLKKSKIQGMIFMMSSIPPCLIISSSRPSQVQMLNDFLSLSLLYVIH